jgi:membrane protein DedA with SNARE-associated domain
MQVLHNWSHLLLTFFFNNELLALFLILFVEEAGVPMPPPGYALLILAGAQQNQSPLHSLLVVAVAGFAAFGGSYLTFFLVRHYGRERLLRYARFVRVKQSRIEQMERWMQRYGLPGIAAGRLIPGLRVPTIFVAGLTGVRYRTFAIIDGAAAVVWAAGYFWLGALIQPKWLVRAALHAMDRPLGILLVLGFTLAALLLIRYWLRRNRAQPDVLALGKAPASPSSASSASSTSAATGTSSVSSAPAAPIATRNQDGEC